MFTTIRDAMLDLVDLVLSRFARKMKTASPLREADVPVVADVLMETPAETERKLFDDRYWIDRAEQERVAREAQDRRDAEFRPDAPDYVAAQALLRTCEEYRLIDLGIGDRESTFHLPANGDEPRGTQVATGCSGRDGWSLHVDLPGGHVEFEGEAARLLMKEARLVDTGYEGVSPDNGE